MAVGDVVIALSSVANNAFLDIQPGSSVEWAVHNLYYNGAVEVYFYDGTNSILIDSDTAAGSRQGGIFHATNTKYFRLKNVSGSTTYFGYDGIITK